MKIRWQWTRSGSKDDPDRWYIRHDPEGNKTVYWYKMIILDGWSYRDAVKNAIDTLT